MEMKVMAFDNGSVEFNALNWGSICCSTAILGSMAWMRFKKPDSVSRVSLRIQAVIALNDIVRHLNLIYNRSSNDVLCSIWGFLFYFCFHSNTFLNAAIALNLHILYIQEKDPPQRLGRYLYTLPILFALVIDLIPFAVGAYGKLGDVCALKDENKYTRVIDFTLLFITNYPFLLYCLVVPVIVIFKLLMIKSASRVPAKPEERSLLTPVQDPVLRDFGFRVSLYPLACALCHLCDIFYNINYLLEDPPNEVLEKANMIGLCLNGTVNFICFLCDPFVQNYLKPLSRNDSEEGSSRRTVIPNYSQETCSHVTTHSTRDDSPPPQRSKPIPIPGAKEPGEVRYHTSDLHLDWKLDWADQYPNAQREKRC